MPYCDPSPIRTTPEDDWLALTAYTFGRREEFIEIARPRSDSTERVIIFTTAEPGLAEAIAETVEKFRAERDARPPMLTMTGEARS